MVGAKLNRNTSKWVQHLMEESLTTLRGVGERDWETVHGRMPQADLQGPVLNPGVMCSCGLGFATRSRRIESTPSRGGSQERKTKPGSGEGGRGASLRWGFKAKARGTTPVQQCDNWKKNYSGREASAKSLRQERGARRTESWGGRGGPRTCGPGQVWLPPKDSEQEGIG